MDDGSGKLVQFPGEPRESVADVLGEVLRQGARKMLGEAIEAEVAEYLKSREGLGDEAGHQVVVRNGHLPERKLQTPVGDIAVQQPRVRDRRQPVDREAFQSSIGPAPVRWTVDRLGMRSFSWGQNAPSHPSPTETRSGPAT
jgi:hypothetical protein